MPESRAHVPRYSIVIPTYRRAAMLRACLGGCRSLEYPLGRFEVIIVDDGDDETTRRVVADFVHLLPLAYIPRPRRRGPASARNAGAAAARGEFVVFIDDDCVPSPGWLHGMDAVLASAQEPLLAGGRIENQSSGNVYAAASQNLVDFLYEWFNRDPDDARFFASNNLACSREAFMAIGGFDEGFPRAAAEDRDFCDRWREHGWRLVSAPDAIVRHRHRLSLHGFVRQHFGYGRGAVYLHDGRERRGVRRPKLEPMRFYWNLLAYPLRKFSEIKAATPSRGALVLLAIVSQVSYAAGFYTERLARTGVSGRQRRPVHTPVDVARPTPSAARSARNQ